MTVVYAFSGADAFYPIYGRTHKILLRGTPWYVSSLVFSFIFSSYSNEVGVKLVPASLGSERQLFMPEWFLSQGC